MCNSLYLMASTSSPSSRPVVLRAGYIVKRDDVRALEVVTPDTPPYVENIAELQGLVDIYRMYHKASGKSYIGQSACVDGRGRRTGALERVSTHYRDGGKQKGCRALNDALVEHGL